MKNNGQLPENVLLTSRLNYGDIYIEKDGSITIKVISPEELDEKIGHPHPNDIQKRSSGGGQSHGNLIPTHTFKLNFLGAKFTNGLDGEKLDFKVNFFKGKTPEQWATNLTPYSEIILKNIYPKTDLKLYFKGNSLKYEYILQKGADLSNLKIKYTGLENIDFAKDKIELVTSVGIIVDENPVSYFISEPSKFLKTKFIQLDQNTFEISCGLKEVNQTLIVDPQLNFASFTGATLDNWGYTATNDDAGFAYTGGIAFGGGYPTTIGAFQEPYGGGQIDMTISKFSPDGSSLIYSSYIGGSGLEAPHSMIVNTNNELVVYGITSSIDYPVSLTAFDRTFNGGTSVSASNVLDFTNGTDIVITKLSPDGSAILGSTYYGGSSNDALNDAANLSGLSHNYADDYRGEVTTDGTGNIFISSVTESTDLPTTGGFQTTFGGGTQDGCVAKFNSDLSGLIWGSYFGGSGDDACYASKQNSLGETYITGGTNSNNVPGLSNSNSGGIDGFLARISANGSSVINGVYIGTPSYDQSYFVEVDFEDKVYCFGQSLGDMPVTSGVYQNTGSKQFLQKYSEDFSTLEAGTVIGSGNGTINIVPGAFMVSNCKEVYLSGWGGLVNGDLVGTQNMPTTPDAHQGTTNGSDFYFMLLGPDFSSFKYGSYFGGSTLYEHVDGGTSRFDRSGTIYQAVCAGCGASSAFPVSPAAYSTTNNSTNCNLALIKMDISKLTANIKFTKDSTHCENEPVTFENQSTGGTEYQWIYPDGSISKSFNGEYFFEDTGKYTISLIAIDSTQCPFADTADIHIQVIKVPEILIEIDTFLCANNSLTINSIGGPIDTNYVWWSIDSTFLSNGPDLTVMPDSTTRYFVEYSNKCGKDTTQVDIPVYYPPVSSTQMDTICEEVVPSYYFFNHEDYVVTEINNKPFQLNNDSIYFNKNTPGPYYINTEGSCGNAIDTFNINFIEIDAQSGPDTVVCAGDRLQIFAKGGEKHIWPGEEPGTFIEDSLVTIYPNESKTYYPLIVKGKCFEIDTVDVQVFPRPEQPFNEEYIINFGEFVTISLNPEFSYDWSPVTHLDCNKCFQVTSTPDEDMKYYFTYSDSQSCKITDSLLVKVIFPIFIPNTFTPNGDGKNDIFYAYSEILDDYELFIFDRWGNLAFKTTNLSEGWDGNINGNPQPEDVYVYKLRYILRHTDPWIEKVGTVNLIR